MNLYSGQLRVSIRAATQADAEALFEDYLDSYGSPWAPESLNNLADKAVEVVEQDVIEV